MGTMQVKWRKSKKGKVIFGLYLQTAEVLFGRGKGAEVER